VGIPSQSPQALDFDVAIMLRGLYEERRSREVYEREHRDGEKTVVDADKMSDAMVM
jgi:hypothetical protein